MGECKDKFCACKPGFKGDGYVQSYNFERTWWQGASLKVQGYYRNEMISIFFVINVTVI
jgi:hypothetical protein